MEQHPQERHPEAHPGLRAEEHPAATGHPRVDEVLGALEQLPGRPVAEHVAVFEAAHTALREALSDVAPVRAGDPTASGPVPA